LYSYKLTQRSRRPSQSTPRCGHTTRKRFQRLFESILKQFSMEKVYTHLLLHHRKSRAY